jgi:hypothetical protein
MARSDRLPASSSAVERLEPRRLLASISGTVWNDLDTSRRLNGDETGLAGWGVYIDENNNRQFDTGEQTTFTDAQGNYRFDDLAPGTYSVGLIVQNGWGQTFPTFEGNRSGSFDIRLDFVGEIRRDVKLVFEQAAQVWESIIAADLPDAEDAFGWVDDIAISISVAPLDGPGGILGYAGPTALRPGSLLPFRAIAEFDTFDSDPEDPVFYETVLHEMAHALGFTDSIWRPLGLTRGIEIFGRISSNPRFTGVNATREYNAIFGTNEDSVPLEPGFQGDGSSVAHWAEDVFGDELMSPFASVIGSPEPLSRITIAAFQDMGYKVRYGPAEHYVAGTGVGDVPPELPTGDDNPARLRGGDALYGGTYIGGLAAPSHRTGGTDPFMQTVEADDFDATDVDFGVRLNSRPQFTQVLVQPAPQVLGENIVLEAVGVSDPDGDRIRGVTFFRESNGIPGLQTGSDTFISTKTSPRKGGRWTAETATTDLGVGDVVYYARVTDDLGASVTRSGAGTLLGAPQDVPTKPTALIATPLSSSRILLEWADQSLDESGFRIQRSTDPHFRTNIVTYTTGSGQNSLLLTDLPPATEFHFRVRAFNSAGNSAYSNRAFAVTNSAGEAIVDNQQASFKGNWSTLFGDEQSPTFGPDAAVYFTTDRRNSDRATFTPFIDYAGQYFIYARWADFSDTGNSAAVPIDITRNGRIDSIVVDQSQRPGGWVLLGRYNLKAGDGTSVRFNAGRVPLGTGVVVADAVRFLPAFVPTAVQVAAASGNARVASTFSSSAIDLLGDDDTRA